MSEQAEEPQTGSALSSKNFRTYLYGSIFSLVGIWIQRLAIGWHAWQLSESAFVVGLVAASQFLPVLLFTPLFGVIVDRIHARSGSLLMNALMMVVAVLLGVVTFSGSMTVNILVVLAVIHGIVVSAYAPTRLALLPELVPRKQFPSAAALISTAFNLSRFVGPMLAGAVVAFWGLGWAYIINAATYLPVLMSLGALTIDPARKARSAKAPYTQQLREGIMYTREHKVIRQTIVLSAIVAFCGRGILELMPAFAAIVFSGGSGTLAALMSSAGVGAIVASLILNLTRIQGRLRGMILLGAVVAGLAVGLFAFIPNLYFGMTLVAVLGFSTTLVGVGSQILVQMRVDDRLRGRVMSLWTLVSMGGPALGSLVGGALVREFGGTITNTLYALISLSLIVVFVPLRKERTLATPGE